MHICLVRLRKAVLSLPILGAGLLLFFSGCHASSGWIMNNSGMGYYQKGNYSMARKEFERAVMDSPRQPDFRHNLAMAMQKQGDPVMAEQVLRHNLTVDPMHQPTYHALTEMLIAQQRIDEADQLLAGWRESQPYLPEAYIEQAWFQQEIGNREAAEQTLRQALQIKPNHPVALAQLGQVYHQSGQTGQAATMYQRSLMARWNQPQVRSRLASLSVPSATPASVSRSAMMVSDPNQSVVLAGVAAPTATPFQPVSMSQPVELNAPVPVVADGMPMPMSPMPPMMVGGAAVDPALMIPGETSPRRLRRQRRRNGPLVAYPLPDFGSVAAWQPPLASDWASPAPMIPEVPAGAVSPAVPAPAPDEIPIPVPIPLGAAPHDHAHQHAHAPTPIPHADPAHSEPMTASLPVVDPY